LQPEASVALSVCVGTIQEKFGGLEISVQTLFK
jgi:hypothetical protein